MPLSWGTTRQNGSPAGEAIQISARAGKLPTGPWRKIRSTRPWTVTRRPRNASGRFQRSLKLTRAGGSDDLASSAVALPVRAARYWPGRPG